MTKDDIILLIMAREAGLEDWTVHGRIDDKLVCLKKFASLVAAAEREACANVCDDKAKETFSGQCQAWGDYFARAIRARG